MKKELKLLSGALLAVSLLSGCATKEETEVITETATVEQTQIMQKIDEMTKLQQLEEKIGVKVPDEKRCHVQQALDNGHSIEKIIELNPELVTA